ncbi:hypothetical protein BDV96DRAFT_115467 [Lophiotrema nucula]|uniref:CFEM domain-containing protein n=1 Tax=Lophiotrema nucula TaxID=690887 RepID=A0A6A5Z5F8_9PLEO|nr:hypothetical protein BDV96DRAFT_115467 [Lophiotrema nucula]
MRAPSTLTLVAFLTFAVDQIVAEDPKDQIGKLPVCAQACITKAFSRCKCTILDFNCACNCDVFKPYSQSCTNTSCAASYLDPVLNAIDGSCATFTNTATALPQTSSASSSFESSLTTTSMSTDTTTGSSSDASITTIPTDATFSKDDVNPTITGSPTTPGGGFYPYTSTSTYQTYSYCYPVMNGTRARGNYTASCTGAYTGPLYTGNVAVGRSEQSSWVLSLVAFVLGFIVMR